MEPPDAIRFYFSFRSPYAWLATERLEAELGDLPVAIDPIPIFPTPGDFPNDPTALPDKVRHIVLDVVRLTREQGLPLKFPVVDDPDWATVHAAYLGARRAGSGLPFMREAYRARFSRGLDLGQDEVIGDAAARAGLDPAAIVEAGHTPALRDEVTANFRRGIERDRIFGVPSFVYKGELFWGQDRMRFVRAAVLADAAA